jgi:beta-ureidopropionase
MSKPHEKGWVMSRKVKVATVAYLYKGGPTVEDNRKRISELLDQAVTSRPDIIALPETFVSQGVAYTALDQIAESVPGMTTDLVSRYARKYGCYIICPLIAIHGNTFMNDAVLIDRRGQIVGTYSKIHPVVQGSEFTSLEMGVTPGKDIVVFDTDFGRIGIQICFDLMYPEGWATLKQKGAEAVFWCSAYDGGKHLSVPAWLHHYYIVSAVQSRYARVIDILGNTVAKSGWYDPVLTQTIDLDIGLFHCDFNATVIPDIHKHYGADVTIQMMHEEGLFTLVSNREELTVGEVIKTFKLDPLDDYISRCAKLQDTVRNGTQIKDLTPAYVGRSQWL